MAAALQCTGMCTLTYTRTCIAAYAGPVSVDDKIAAKAAKKERQRRDLIARALAERQKLVSFEKVAFTIHPRVCVHAQIHTRMPKCLPTCIHAAEFLLP